MTNVHDKDPFRGYNFQVDIDGIDSMAFSEVTGLTAEGDSVDYREGSEVTNTVRKLVGLRKYGNVTLKRGYTKNDEFWKWYEKIAGGLPDRRSVTITLMNEARDPVLTWACAEAWINKVEGPSFNASGNEVAIESVELIHEGLTFEINSGGESSE
jgi:phage tail-like protein